MWYHSYTKEMLVTYVSTKVSVKEMKKAIILS
ncbi:hypothetical protein J2S24_002492 [Thermoanaerobacter pentosaceus]|uniref:Uncharacterized protein n=1 Tax=Thermoanaerobacter pentosaceus TaxID=694059 RepID=A0ABT9M760_9THEO|nr:hypothetical protein [Thermoanaerobacter pentosaceus]